MVEFKLTWMSESGRTRTDTGRATIEEIDEWNAKIRKAVEESDQSAKVTIPTDGDGDWGGSQIRAILVKEIKVKAQRPAGW